MLDMQTLKILDKISKKYWECSKNAPWIEHIRGEMDHIIFYELRNVFFSMITGEPDFDKFYGRFDAPAVRTGKPVAWGPRFLPDLISEDIWAYERSITERVKNIKKLYKKCINLEKKHQK